MPADPVARRALMALGLAAFLQLGGLQAAYGPAFAALQARHGVGARRGGAERRRALLRRLRRRDLVGRAAGPLRVPAAARGGRLLMASGAAAIALAPVWAAVLVGAGVIGLGYGLTAVLINFLLARAFAPRGAAAVNVINGAFGVGAVVGPALIGLATATLAARAPDGLAGVTLLVFGVAALLAAALVVGVVLVPWWPPVAPAGRRAKTRRPPVAPTAMFAALLFVYVAIEVSTSSWARPTWRRSSTPPEVRWRRRSSGSG
jgi:MFS transporter, FHS family, glucose/mannose:H+ symporter